jgi:hypothetical protein
LISFRTLDASTQAVQRDQPESQNGVLDVVVGEVVGVSIWSDEIEAWIGMVAIGSDFIMVVVEAGVWVTVGVGVIVGVGAGVWVTVGVGAGA